MSRRHVRRFAFALVSLALAVAIAGCPATRGRRHEPVESGFLGDYSQLEERKDYPERKIYINDEADWSRYDSVHISDVTLWGNEETAKLKPEDQEMLTKVLYKALHEKIGESFEISDRATANSLYLRAALTQAKGAKTPLRAITSIHPGTIVLGAATSLATDVAKTVGTATTEMEIRDSITRERLAAAVDERAGTKVLFLISPRRTFTTWGDVKAAAKFWAENVRDFLVAQGVRQK